MHTHAALHRTMHPSHCVFNNPLIASHIAVICLTLCVSLLLSFSMYRKHGYEGGGFGETPWQPQQPQQQQHQRRDGGASGEGDEGDEDTGVEVIYDASRDDIVAAARSAVQMQFEKQRQRRKRDRDMNMEREGGRDGAKWTRVSEEASSSDPLLELDIRPTGVGVSQTLEESDSMGTLAGRLVLASDSSFGQMAPKETRAVRQGLALPQSHIQKDHALSRQDAEERGQVSDDQVEVGTSGSFSDGAFRTGRFGNVLAGHAKRKRGQEQLREKLESSDEDVLEELEEEGEPALEPLDEEDSDGDRFLDALSESIQDPTSMPSSRIRQNLSRRPTQGLAAVKSVFSKQQRGRSARPRAFFSRPASSTSLHATSASLTQHASSSKGGRASFFIPTLASPSTSGPDGSTAECDIDGTEEDLDLPDPVAETHIPSSTITPPEGDTTTASSSWTVATRHDLLQQIHSGFLAADPKSRKNLSTASSSSSSSSSSVPHHAGLPSLSLMSSFQSSLARFDRLSRLSQVSHHPLLATLHVAAVRYQMGRVSLLALHEERNEQVRAIADAALASDLTAGSSLKVLLSCSPSVSSTSAVTRPTSVPVPVLCIVKLIDRLR